MGVVVDQKIGNDIICRRVEEKGLGVIVSENMSPEKHINRITKHTWNLLRNIRTLPIYVLG